MDLSTQYLGLLLRSPLVVSASPLSREMGHIREMEDAGAGAIVLYSLFEEHTTACRANYEFGSLIGPEAYMDHIVDAKRSVGTPIIASLNGSTHRGWKDLARQIEDAGADALELNINHIPGGAGATGWEIENDYLEIVQMVRMETRLPLAVKLSPYFTNFANMATRLDALGVEGLVLFNRLYQPDIDIARMVTAPGIVLSDATDMRLPMHWIANLFGRLGVDLAATSGIHGATDVIKMVMAGADVTMLCSTLMQHGIRHLEVIERETGDWLEKHEFCSLDEIRGKMSHFNRDDAGTIDRAQYVQALESVEVG
jgi:dihydroorotate dehydrogenase (fumarate)